MGKLVYTAIASLDGYIADAEGRFDWSVPDAEVHAHVNDRERAIGTYLLGRRMYDVLVAWETMPVAGQPAEIRDFARQWRGKDKIVFSRTLTEPRSTRTRIEPEFQPGPVATLVAAAGSDVSVSGPTLAADAIRAGLVGEIALYVNPVVVGGGTAALPAGVRLDLDLVDEHRFGSGVVHLRYAVRRR